MRASRAACGHSSRCGASVSIAAMLRWAGRSGSLRPRCSSASKLPDRWWDSSRAGRSFIPEQTCRSPAGPGPWRSRKSPSTSAATFRQAPTMPPPKPRSPASRRRSRSSMSQNHPRIRSASSAATSISGMSCSPVKRRRRPAAHRTVSFAVCCVAGTSSRAPAIRRPIPASGSTSYATLRMCLRLLASGCAAGKSSSPARWCRRLQ
jgi:hypothetical protein